MKRAVIGIDGGGTHSRGVLLTLTGELLALESAGPSNYLSVGLRPATEALHSLVARLKTAAKEQGAEIVAAGFGLSGLDRPKDADEFKKILTTAGATACPYELVNDAFLALRAGTLDGVGVAAVSGTGSNTVGVDAHGRHERVGGLAFEFGDFGGADDIGIAALRCAFKDEQGRGPRTTLGALIKKALGLARLDELLDRVSPDTTTPFKPGALAPVVFDAANQGDRMALGILQNAGHDLGIAALVVAERLFEEATSFPLVVGGRVLAEGTCDAMRDALVDELRPRFPEVRLVKLETDPVLGAALLAIDRLGNSGPSPWPDHHFLQTAKAALAQRRAP